MAWSPPVPAGVALGGVTTIRWGTDGTLQSPKPATGFYVVTRFNQRSLIESVKLPQGSGLTSTRILIEDGMQWSITVRDDSAMDASGLRAGVTVSIVDMGGLISTQGLRYNATIVDPSYDGGLKQPGEKILVVERLRLVEGTGGTYTTGSASS